MTRVAAVMVTHNGGQRLLDQIDTMCRQSRPLDQVVIVDDRSTDGYVDRAVSRLREFHDDVIVRPARPGTGTDLFGRIGRNFAQGVDLAGPDVDFIVFADQDDLWREDRVEVQAARLQDDPSCAVSAANGTVIDDSGSYSGQTLWDAFGVPRDWNERNDVERLRVVLSRSVATGAAMIARSAFAKSLGRPPGGWLHDRWYSIVAASRGALDLQDRSVIDYRQHDGQSAGLAGNSSRLSLLTQAVRGPIRALDRFSAIHSLRSGSPSPLRRELSYPMLVKTMARRPS
ncbi:glycosyltransferase [Microbacterium sp. Ru50]|uniref:glycosyltransferase n=1 Tax=Microbacterium sp. Ru50 TaxID=2080744 RepID=UPI0015E1FBD0|nr:glycosyltransferase [Microbacterium sp. Ru50]